MTKEFSVPIPLFPTFPLTGTGSVFKLFGGESGEIDTLGRGGHVAGVVIPITVRVIVPLSTTFVSVPAVYPASIIGKDHSGWPRGFIVDLVTFLWVLFLLAFSLFLILPQLAKRFFVFYPPIHRVSRPELTNACFAEFVVTAGDKGFAGNMGLEFRGDPGEAQVICGQVSCEDPGFGFIEESRQTVRKTNVRVLQLLGGEAGKDF